MTVVLHRDDWNRFREELKPLNVDPGDTGAIDMFVCYGVLRVVRHA